MGLSKYHKLVRRHPTSACDSTYSYITSVSCIVDMFFYICSSQHEENLIIFIQGRGASGIKIIFHCDRYLANPLQRTTCAIIHAKFFPRLFQPKFVESLVKRPVATTSIKKKRHTNRDTDTQTHRQTGSQRNRLTQTDRCRQTDRHTTDRRIDGRTDPWLI